MKNVLWVFFILSLIGCAKDTEFGRCVGLNGKKDPSLLYEYSARNIAVGVFFFSLIAPPVIVGLNELECPVSRK